MTTEPKAEGGEAVVLVEDALHGLPRNAPIKHPERDNAELAYTLTAFNYEEHPVGGEFWCNYWRGWWHRSHMDGSHLTPSAVEALARAASRANGEHIAPHDCYATGPLTGDPYRDLVSCPGCELAAALTHPEIAALLKEKES